MKEVFESGKKVGCQGSSVAGGRDKKRSDLCSHLDTPDREIQTIAPEVARDRMTPSHAGDEAASRELGRACPEANAEACSTLRRATHAGIHM